jgi:hypothetical protein
MLSPLSTRDRHDWHDWHESRSETLREQWRSFDNAEPISPTDQVGRLGPVTGKGAG